MVHKKPPPDEQTVRLRIVITDPVPGVLHSLQDRDNAPVAPQRAATGASLEFAFEVRVKVTGDAVRWLGEHVRREGPTRRFVYVAVGTQAGEADSTWSRRMKIDVHTIGRDLLEAAARGKQLEVIVPGRGADGSPACATVRASRPWRAV